MASSNNLPHAAIPSPEELCNLRLIPEELLKIVVSFGDVASNVCLAATNPWFRRFVYKKCPSAWNEIDFDQVPSSLAARISDTELSKLLTNVNARCVTTFLSIMGCTSIQGPGLSALTNSQCLQVIDLRKGMNDYGVPGETGLDEPLVIDVLSSMAPINTKWPYSCNGGLKLVKFRKQNGVSNQYERHNDRIRSFLVLLNEAIARQARTKQVACNNCQQRIFDNDSSIDLTPDFNWKARTCYCSKCKNFKCCGYSANEKCHWREDVCSCYYCMEQFCSDCKVVDVCSMCERACCEDCLLPVSHCNECSTSFCQHLSALSPLSKL